GMLQGVDHLYLKRLALQIIQKRVHHLCSSVVRQANDLAFHVAHEAFEIITGIGDAHYAQRGTLPEIGALDLSHRDIERIAKAVFDAAQDLALVLERVRGLDAKFKSEIGDGHAGEKLTADRRGSARIHLSGSAPALLPRSARRSAGLESRESPGRD